MYHNGELPQSDEHAAEWYTRALELDPQHTFAKDNLAVLRADESALYADHKYVTSLFDEYAEDFDKHLNELGYQVPRLMAQVLAPIIGKDQIRVSRESVLTHTISWTVLPQEPSLTHVFQI